MVLRLMWITFKFLTLLSVSVSTSHMYLSNIWYQLISIEEKVDSWGEFSLDLRHLGSSFSEHLGGLCVSQIALDALVNLLGYVIHDG